MLSTRGRFLKRNFIYLPVGLVLLVLVSCGDGAIPLLPGSSDDGFLVINLMLAPAGPGQQGKTPEDILGIVAVEVEVTGVGIDKPVQKGVNLYDYQGQLTLKVPEGNNRVIIISGKDAQGSAQAVIKGYVKIVADEKVYTEVNWQTTPVGEVIEGLIARGYKEMDTYNASELQDLVDSTVKEHEIHPIFINTEEIVKHILTTGSNPSSLPIITPIPITGKVLSQDGEPLGMVPVFINHPPFQEVTTDENGRFQILPGVTPGEWIITGHVAQASLPVNGVGSVTVQVRSDGTVVPAEPVIVIPNGKNSIVRGSCVNIFTRREIPQVEMITDIGVAITDTNGEFEIIYEQKKGEYTCTANHTDFLPSAGTVIVGGNVSDVGVITLIPIPQLAGEVDSVFGFDTPWSIVLSDDEGQAFVVNRDGNFVSIIDAHINKEVGTVDVGKMPLGAAYTDGQLFVANNWDNTVSVIDPLQRKVIEDIEVLGLPAYVAAHGDKLFVTVQDAISGNQVAVVDIGMRRVERRIQAGEFPHGIAVDPFGRALYVANYDWDNISWIDLGAGGDILVPVGPNPQGVAVSPDGEYVYTADIGRISRIDVNRQIVVDRFLQPGTRFGCVAVVELPDDKGDLVYATDMAGNQVWMWHPESEAQAKSASINVGFSPFGLAATQDGLKVYVCAAEDNQVQWLENR